MNTTVKHFHGICFSLLAMSGSFAGQKAEVSRKVEFENEQVRVERIVIPARDSSPMHDHKFPSVEVFLTDDHIRETLSDGTSREWRARAGQVTWVGTASHRVENLRNAATEIIVVQLKALPAAALKLGSQPAADEFENDWVSVTRTRMAAKEMGAQHTHPQYVGVFLSEANLRLHSPDGTARDVSGKRGDAAWRGPVTHKVENLADNPFEAIDVNLKPSAKSEPERKKIAINGTELAYVEQGSGEPLVLVHGSLADYRMWQGMMPELAAKYRVIAYSRRCHWPNECPRGSPYTFDVHAEDLAEVIRKVANGRAHLVAHSYGGSIGALLAARHPELLRSAVLIEPGIFPMLSDTPEGRSVAAQMAEAGTRAREALAHDLDEEAVRQLMDFVFRPRGFADLSPEIRKALLENVPSLRASVVAAGPPLSFSCDDARNLKMRVLILEGQNTAPEFRLMDDALLRCLPEPKRKVIAGADHGLIFESPRETAEAILEFLASNN